jgi:DNA-directed RNA polymerase subunit F
VYTASTTQTQMTTRSSRASTKVSTTVTVAASNSQMRRNTMEIMIDIDQRTYNHLKSQAEADRMTVEELVEELVEENYG